MNYEAAFDSIESAHEFLTLFTQVVLETKRDLEAHLQRESRSNSSRRVEALQIIAYLLERLETDVKQSRRILNDLRSLRRLLFGERAHGNMVVRPTSVGTARARSSPPSPSPRVSRPAADGGADTRDRNTHITVKRRALSSVATDAGNSRAGDTVPWYVRQDINSIARTATTKAPQ